MNPCYAAGPDCDGPVEAHHLVKRQRIRAKWRTLMAAKRRGGPKPWSVTKAIADERNIVYACKRTHHVEETPVPLPAGFWDFIAEYDLAGQLPRWLACGAAAPKTTSVCQETVVIREVQPSREEAA